MRCARREKAIRGVRKTGPLMSEHRRRRRVVRWSAQPSNHLTCVGESKSMVDKMTGMKVATILGAMIMVAMNSRADNPATTQPTEAYQLVWSDEFDRDGAPNPDDWQYESGFVRNRELQWYQQ